jgi:murein biosynthesis integral membrane protein MurJ
MNLLKAASTVSVLTLASRVTGLIREALIASAFGASALTDAFNVAWRIPNLLRRLFAEGAFAQAFVPILAATRERDGDDATHRLVDAVATVLWWCLLATVVIGVAAAPAVVWLVASGLQRFDDAVWMTRVMFPTALISMVSLAAGILNTWRRFAVPAATPVLLNVCVIAAAVGRAVVRDARHRALRGRRWHRSVASCSWRSSCPRCAPSATCRAWGSCRDRWQRRGTIPACSVCSGRWGRRCSACRWRRSRC